MTDIGKTPPQAVDLEEAVLGSILVQPDCYDEIADRLVPEMFYKEAHKVIYTQIRQNIVNQKPADLLSVKTELEENGQLDNIGGVLYLTDMTGKIASTSLIRNHAEIIREKYKRRQVIYIAEKAKSLAYEGEAGEVLNYLENALFELTGDSLEHEPRELLDIYNELGDYLQELSKRDVKLTGVPTGYIGLDKLTNGWQPSDLIIVAARPSMGKCQSPDTKVIMADGSLRMLKDIKPGDYLMGDDSSPRKVISTISGKDNMYEVKQSNAITYKVNSQHILSLQQAKEKKIDGYSKCDVIDIPIQEYLNKSKKQQKKHWKGYKVGFELEKKTTALEPYFLGLWLADGSKGKINIHNPDKEVLDYLKEYAIKNDLQCNNHNHKKINKCPSTALTGRNGWLLNVLRQANLLHNKHIPEDYLLNSKKKRLELLAGLLDGDGYLQNGHIFEITQKDQNLTYQIKYLADSLGFKTTVHQVEKGIKTRNFKGIYYKLYISGDLDIIPTRIKRKQALPRTCIRNPLLSTLSIKDLGIGDYCGVELDGNGRYLLEDGTVTHNSAAALNFAYNAAIMNKKVLLFSLEMSSRQLAMRLLARASGIESEKIRSATGLDWDQVNDAIFKDHNRNIILDDRGGRSVFDLRSTIRKYKRKHDIDLVIIDYLQLVKGDERYINKSIPKYFGSVGTVLKETAKEMDMPIMLLSQLNRAVEDRENKVPRLSDLKESGDIEQDADIVLFPFRYAMYKQYHEHPEYGDMKRKGHLQIAKHRNGPLGKVFLTISEDVSTWKEWDKELAKTQYDFD